MIILTPKNVLQTVIHILLLAKYYRLAGVISKQKSERVTKKSSIFRNLYIDVVGMDMVNRYILTLGTKLFYI